MTICSNFFPRKRGDACRKASIFEAVPMPRGFRGRARFIFARRIFLITGRVLAKIVDWRVFIDARAWQSRK